MDTRCVACRKYYQRRRKLKYCVSCYQLLTCRSDILINIIFDYIDRFGFDEFCNAARVNTDALTKFIGGCRKFSTPIRRRLVFGMAVLKERNYSQIREMMIGDFDEKTKWRIKQLKNGQGN